MRARPLCVALLLLASRTIAHAAEPGELPDDDKQWRRALDQHLFMPSLAVVDPFVPTEFSLTTGAGYAWANGSGFDVRGNAVGNGSYVAASLSEAVSFQAGLFSWLALRVRGGGGLYGGFNARSALVLGATMPLTVEPGLTASWQLGRFLRLGGTFDYVYQYAKLIDPLSLVRTSLASGQVDTSQVSQRVIDNIVLPGVTAAFAPLRAIGLLASVQYRWDGRDNGTTTQNVNYLIVGASTQLDVRPIVASLPLGVLAAYRAEIPLGSTQRLIETVEGALFYTGRKDLALGLDVEGQWFVLRSGSPITFSTSAIVGSLIFNYYWN